MSDPNYLSINAPHDGAWLCYINGIEVPCPSIQVSYGVWGIPQAQLTFPAHRLLQRLGAEDRLDVVVFYLDTTANPEQPQFQLLFEGDIIGWSYSSTAAGRGMSFDAIGDISIFTQLFLFFLNNAQAVTSREMNIAERATSVPQTGVFYPHSLFKKGLLVNGEDIDRPFDMVYNAVKGFLSKDQPAERRAIPAINFFARWARKKNFHNRFAALPMFEDEGGVGLFPIFKAVQAQFAVDAMQTNLAESVGERGSIFDVIQQLLQVVYCELAMIPTAPMFRVRLSDGTILGAVDGDDRTEPRRLINYYVKPQMLFGIAPSCNVVYPSMSPSISYQENYLEQPTRSYINEQFVMRHMRDDFSSGVARVVGYPPEVNVMGSPGALRDREGVIHPHLSGKNVLVFPEEFFKGPVVARHDVPPWITILETVQQEPGEQRDKQLTELLGLYSQYEHYRGRYAKRGGAVDLAWNPYVVPGFPCIVFDSAASGHHLAGYVMTVVQRLDSSQGAGSMNTSLNFSYGRTLYEMFDVLAHDMKRTKCILGSAPIEPINSVRAVSHDFEQAEQFYNTLFHGRQQTPGRKASFDFRETLGIDLTGPSASEQVALEQRARDMAMRAADLGADGVGDGGEERIQSVTAALEIDATDLEAAMDDDITPHASFAHIFESYDAAMQYVSRPICTLHQYLEFIHGGASVAELTEAGEVEGAMDYYTETPTGEVGTVYYERIKRVRPGPGEHPPPSVTGAEEVTREIRVVGGVNVEMRGAVPYTEANTGVAADFPQTRADWDSVLLAYRDAMYANEPQQ